MTVTSSFYNYIQIPVSSNPNMTSEYYFLCQQCENGKISTHYISLNTPGKAKLLIICFESSDFL